MLLYYMAESNLKNNKVIDVGWLRNHPKDLRVLLKALTRVMV